MTVTAAPPLSIQSAEPADRLAKTFAAFRLSFAWLGCSKALSSDQRAVAAEAFGATHQALSAGKKLLDTRHPAFSVVTSVRRRAIAAWKGATLPFPEAGVRLIRRNGIARLDAQLDELRQELAEGAQQLDEHYDELLARARQRLGSLFERSDYPARLRDWFSMEWDYPNVQPPDYLRQLSPELYEQECRRVRARFEEAVELAEGAFAEEFARLVGHLCERISGADGSPKVFRDSAVEHLSEFFERFRTLNLGSQPELDALVERAKAAVGGVSAQDLRRVPSIRTSVAEELRHVQSGLDAMLVDRPRRRIIRTTFPENEG